MITTIKKITNILVEDKKLYEECGKVFTYLNELKINFSNIEYHNIAWQYSQVIEIVYSNKLENIDLNIFDVIVGFADETKVSSKVKGAIAANFDTTIDVSNYRKNNELIKFEIIDIIWNKIKSEPIYSKIAKSNNIMREANILSDYEKNVFEKLLNSTYSNNGLYFIGFFMYLFMKFNQKNKLVSIVRSIMTNLYLMKTKLLFAPTLCISYPLYHNNNDFYYKFYQLVDDPYEIITFTRTMFDIVKQSAIINRAFVNKAIITFSNLEELISKNKILKELKQYPYTNLFKVLAFNEKSFADLLNIKQKTKIKEFVEELLKQKMIVNISNKKEYQMYMFKDLFMAIKKLDRNKTQSTSEIFKLKEDLS